MNELRIFLVLQRVGIEMMNKLYKIHFGSFFLHTLSLLLKEAFHYKKG
jgi:hypothetical protein